MPYDKAASFPKGNKTHDADKLLVELGARDTLDAAATLAGKLLERLGVLDFHCYEGMPAEEAVPHLMRGPVSDAIRLINEAMRLVRSLPHLVGVEPVIGDTEDTRVDTEANVLRGISEGAPRPYIPAVTASVSVDLEAALAPSLAGGPRQSGAIASPAERNAFAALCDRTAAYLKEALEALRLASRERSKWGLVTAGEEARRKMRKSLHATCLTALRLMAVPEAHRYFAKSVSELQSALWVRAVLMAFVVDMEPMTHAAQPLEGVDLGVHLRDVRLLMLQLFSDAHYSELRAPDRFELQKLFGEMSRWLDHAWEDYTQARALMTRATQLAQQLHHINGRDLLVAHDKTVQRQAETRLQALAATPPDAAHGIEPWRRLVETLELLTRMRWRSNTLDTLVQTQLLQLRPPAVSDSSVAPASKAAGTSRAAFEKVTPHNAAQLQAKIEALITALSAVSYDI